MKMYLIIGFTIWASVLSAQQDCEYLEDRMTTIIKTQFDMAEAEELFDDYSSSDCANMLLAYNFIGFAHYNHSNLVKAKEFLIRGEDEYYDRETKPEQFSINQMYTALVLIVEKDFESALYHLKKAENFAKNSPDKFIQSTVFQNLGMVKVQMGELEDAEVSFKKAIDNGGLESIDIGYIYQNLALLHQKKNNHEKLEEYINKTKTVWKELNNTKGIYLLSFIESQHAINTNEFDEALRFLNNGRAAYESNNKLLLGENYLQEAEIHDSLGNVQAKLIALENAIIESTDLSEEQLNNAISSLSDIQDDSKTNIVLTNLVSKLKHQTLSQNRISVARNIIMDTESAEDESIIKSQVKYLAILGTLLILLCYLLFRIRKQKTDIQYLNKSLESSNIETANQVEILKQKNKEVEQFAYVASHDLKSPLNTISSFAELLKRKHSSDEASDYIDIITRSAQNMTEMISGLLRYSTLDQKLDIQNVNLKDLISDTLNGINSQIIESHGKVEIDESCNQLIQCDRTLFSNVIQNLVSNSLIYCKEDAPPEINISAIQTDEEISIKFSDNGIGIEEAYKSQIFEMFTRLKTKNADGSGIGLATCKKIVENHKGAISVISTFGVGSVFSINIPFSSN